MLNRFNYPTRATSHYGSAGGHGFNGGNAKTLVPNRSESKHVRAVAFRKKVYRSIDELQTDLDSWITEYNEARPHQGRWCFGKTPMQTFLDALPMTKEKRIATSDA